MEGNKLKSKGSQQDAIAEVLASPTGDAFLLRPLQAAHTREVIDALNGLSSGIQIRRTPEGLIVDPWDAERLILLAETGALQMKDDVKRMAENRVYVAASHVAEHRRLTALQTLHSPKAYSYVADLVDSEVLDPHQILNVVAMTSQGSFGLALFDEQGAGKTVSMIFAFDLLVQRDLVDFMLIVCPRIMVS